jgi:hypothetical protein
VGTCGSAGVGTARGIVGLVESGRISNLPSFPFAKEQHSDAVVIREQATRHGLKRAVAGAPRAYQDGE